MAVMMIPLLGPFIPMVKGDKLTVTPLHAPEEVAWTSDRYPAIVQSYHPTNGNTLILIVMSGGTASAPTITSVAQTGVVWTAVGTSYVTAEAYYSRITMYVGVVGAGAEPDLVATGSAYSAGSTLYLLQVMEYAGALTLVSSSGAGSQVGTTKTTGTVTSNNYGRILIGGVIGVTNNGAQTTPTNGFTLYDGAIHTISTYYVSLGTLYLGWSGGVLGSGTTSSGSTKGCGIISEWYINDTTAYEYTLKSLYEDGSALATLAISAIGTDNTLTPVLASTAGETLWFTTAIKSFSWTTLDGYTRFYHPYANSGIYTFIQPLGASTEKIYQFTVKDYSDILTGSDDRLAYYTMINGVEYYTGDMEIVDTLNGVPLTWVYGRSYEVKILIGSSSYSQGWIIAGDDYDINVLLKAFSFSQTAQLSYKYVLVEATRPTATSIVFVWNNTLTPTYNLTSGLITVKYRNGTEATHSHISAESGSFTWNSAVNVTDYKVLAELDHEYLGAINYEKMVSGSEAPATDFPSLDALGSLGDTPMGSLLAVGSLFIIGGSVSFASVPLGAFSMVALAGFYAYRGVMTISSTFLWTLIGLVALLFLASRRGG